MNNDSEKKSKNSKPDYFTFFLILALFLIVIGKIFTNELKPNYSTASDLTLENIISGINNERTLRNLSTLFTDNRLSYAADYKSKDMIEKKYFSHTDPDGNYIWPKIVEAGYTPYLQLGENLAIEFYNTESLIQAWMNSPTHRANILNEGFKDQGMGLAFGNTQNNEHGSAITNTFGTLIIKKISSPTPTPTPSATPTPTPSKTQEPRVLPTTTTPTTTPIPTKIPNTTPTIEITPTEIVPTPLPSNTQINNQKSPQKPGLAIRGEDNSQQPNFATPESSHFATTTTTPAQPKTPNIQNTSAIGKKLNKNSLNRYLSLGVGIILLLGILWDLKLAIEKKHFAVDKKINNLVLLVLSLLVIAFLYWL